MTRPHGAALWLVVCLSVSFYGFGRDKLPYATLRAPPRGTALARLLKTGRREQAQPCSVGETRKFLSQNIILTMFISSWRIVSEEFWNLDMKKSYVPKLGGELGITVEWRSCDERPDDMLALNLPAIDRKLAGLVSHELGVDFEEMYRFLNGFTQCNADVDWRHGLSGLYDRNFDLLSMSEVLCLHPDMILQGLINNACIGYFPRKTFVTIGPYFVDENIEGAYTEGELVCTYLALQFVGCTDEEVPRYGGYFEISRELQAVRVSYQAALERYQQEREAVGRLEADIRKYDDEDTRRGMKKPRWRDYLYAVE